jgi:hypothetical protein
MEDGRDRDGGRTVVAHRFVVRLHPDDLAALRASTPELAATLADGALAFARHHAYTLLDRPVVSIRGDRAVRPTDVAVDALAEDAGPPVVANAEATADGGAASDGAGVTPEHTAVFVVPDAEGPRASFREIRPDQSSRTISFDGRPLTIGRAPDNRVVLRDGRASRHHARVDARRGSLVLTDLGSTNGSFVNDRRVESVALGEGDRIRLGATILVVEAIDDAPPAPAARDVDPAVAGRPAPGG